MCWFLQDTTYESSEFESQGFKHHDLFFTDCSTPSPDVVQKFLDICDQSSGKVAVHCLAGLGRTGTLIGVWMMQHMNFRPDEVIGYLRLVRPGSVIGPQQQYLHYISQCKWNGNRLIPPMVRYQRRLSLPPHAEDRHDVFQTKETDESCLAHAEQVAKAMRARARVQMGPSRG